MVATPAVVWEYHSRGGKEIWKNGRKEFGKDFVQKRKDRDEVAAVASVIKLKIFFLQITGD